MICEIIVAFSGSQPLQWQGIDIIPYLIKINLHLGGIASITSRPIGRGVFLLYMLA